MSEINGLACLRLGAGGNYGIIRLSSELWQKLMTPQTQTRPLNYLRF